jgi:hypothetical protein
MVCWLAAEWQADSKLFDFHVLAIELDGHEACVQS